MNFTIGCDPEIFVADATSLRSIVGRVGGTKLFPRPLEELGDGFAVQEDNVAMEFCIPPAKNRDGFKKSVLTTVDYLDKLVQMQGLHIVMSSAESFPMVELQTPEAQMFGCDPDFNAWTGEMNGRPHVEDVTLRSAGGHVHVGCDGVDIMELIKMMDLRMGVPSVLMDKGEKRKQLYGKWGAFRKKPYGVEYRTLSNFWIFNEKYCDWVYDQTALALEHVSKGRSAEEYRELVHDAINNNNKKTAEKLVELCNLEVVNA